MRCALSALPSLAIKREDRQQRYRRQRLASSASTTSTDNIDAHPPSPASPLLSVLLEHTVLGRYKERPTAHSARAANLVSTTVGASVRSPTRVSLYLRATLSVPTTNYGRGMWT